MKTVSQHKGFHDANDKQEWSRSVCLYNGQKMYHALTHLERIHVMAVGPSLDSGKIDDFVCDRPSIRQGIVKVLKRPCIQHVQEL